MEHAQALEELKLAGLGWATDPQRSLRVPLPDASHWLRVKFWGKKSLVAFRYGKDHHAVVGGFIVHVPDETIQGACSETLEKWAKPWIEVFEVDVAHDPPAAIEWRGKIVDVDSLVAKTATLGMHDQYAGVYAVYPRVARRLSRVWDGGAGPWRARARARRARPLRDRGPTQAPAPDDHRAEGKLLRRTLGGRCSGGDVRCSRPDG